MDQSTFNWLFWLFGFFLAYELAAVVWDWRTLSEQTWNWFSLGQKKVYWPIRRVVFLVFWLVLGIGHFYLQAPALWSVILPGIPFAGVVALSTFVWRDATTTEEETHVLRNSVGFRFSFPTVVAAIVAAGSAAAAAYNLANGDLVVTPAEWLTIAWAAASAAIGGVYHQPREVWSPEKRKVEANNK